MHRIVGCSDVLRVIVATAGVTLMVMLASGTVCAAADPQVKVYGAFFLADQLRPNYKWREGWSLRDEKGNRVEHGEHFKRGGHFLVYLQNTGSEPVSIDHIAIDGVSVEESKKDLQTVWYRVEENPVAPGGIAELTLRIREMKGDSAKLTLTPSVGGPIELTVPLETPHALFETIVFSGDGTRLWAYLSTTSIDDKIVGVEIDGRPVPAKSVKSYATTGGLIPLTLKFDRTPLVYGSFHTIKAVTAGGAEVVSRFRVLDDFFSRSTFAYNAGPKTPEDKARVQNDFNLMCGRVENWGETMHYFNSSPDDQKGIEDWAKTPWNYIHYLMPDEPDCSDFGHSEIEDPHMRIGATAQSVVEGNLLRHKYDKRNPTGMVIDSTFKPSNYYTYARIPDILIPDPYSSEVGEPPSYVFNIVDLCQLTARPAPVWAILYATNDVNSPFGYARYPSKSEMRMETYYALGRGVKGISYWWYWAENPYYGLCDNHDLWDEVSRLMAEVRISEKFLAGAAYTPLSIARTQSDGVRLLSLINTDQGCAVSVINDSFLMTSKKFETTSVKNVEIAANVPKWQKLARVYLLDAGTCIPAEYTRKGDDVIVKLHEVKSAAMLLFVTAEGEKHIESNLKREQPGS